MQQAIPCMIIRGGTSKGVYLLEKDLPPEGNERDKLLLRIMGSPDLRQIDGLGGGSSVTSKVAILGPSDQKGIDVNYTFAQVSIDKPLVSYAGNCGNISAGVGPFAIESGLKKADSPSTTVKILNTNTKKTMVEDVQTPGCIFVNEGDYAIPGVPGTAAPVKVMVLEPAGTICGKLLPTGNPVDDFEIPGFGRLQLSIVDAANPLVFVRAKDIGMNGNELPEEIDQNMELLNLLERIRGEAAKRLGLVERIEDASWKSPGVPKMTVISVPDDYITTANKKILSSEMDVMGRMLSMQKAHPTYAMTGAMCTAAAAIIPGTIVNCAKHFSADCKRIRIAHPGGILEAGVDYTDENGVIKIQSVYGFRTARLILKGTVYC